MDHGRNTSLASLWRWSALVSAAFAAAAVAQPARSPNQQTAQGPYELESRMRKYFSQGAIAAARRAPSSIMAVGAYGDFVSRVPRGLLIRQGAGWRRWAGDRFHAVPSELSREIDSILANPDFWREPSNHRGRCTGGARLMTVRHKGLERSSSQSCEPAGLTGRLSHIAVWGRAPAPSQRGPAR